MITLFVILMIAVFTRMIGFAFRATWGIAKIVFGLVIFPLVLIGLVVGGLVSFALPVLVVVGIVMLIKRASATPAGN
jgi:hypothetical protein